MDPFGVLYVSTFNRRLQRSLRERTFAISGPRATPSRQTQTEVTFTAGGGRGGYYTLHSGHLRQDQQAAWEIQHEGGAHLSQKVSAPAEMSGWMTQTSRFQACTCECGKI